MKVSYLSVREMERGLTLKPPSDLEGVVQERGVGVGTPDCTDAARLRSRSIRISGHLPSSLRFSPKKEGVHVLKEDEIWEAAQQVWADLPNCKIARGYVHAYRIAEKVITHNGDNFFLAKEKGLSCGITTDFHDTLWRVRRKDGKKIAPPAPR